MPGRFDVVLFDLGSTLLYFDGPRQAVLAQADLRLFQELVGAGCLLDPAVFIPTFRDSLQAYFLQREIDWVEHSIESILRVVLAGAGYPDLPDAIVRQVLRRMYAVTEAHWRLEADALSTLAELKRQGYRLGLISNAANAEDVYTMLQQHQLEPYLEQVLISVEVGRRKPHPAVFQKALEFFNVLPERAVMVGDTLNADVLGAQKSGLTSVWMTRRVRPEALADQAAIRPDVCLNTLAELPPALEHWS